MAFNDVLGRIPVQIIEIDQDKCSLVYGVGACTADPGVTGNAKCFNTYATCTAKTAYVLGTPLTLRFAKSHSDIPDAEYIIPSLQSVGTSPTKINVGGRSGSTKPLGRRAEITVSVKDHPHSDNFIDPYLADRSYDPLELGTFWSKWLKRNPYYNGRALRVLDGYVGQTLAEMKTRNYVIESISLPDSRGNVTIKAQDILRLADNDKAQAPKLSNGKLLTDITAVATSIVVTGGNISEYNQNSTLAIRIGDEIIRYASITVGGGGDLTFNTCVRGSDGTIADTHDIDDSVQACLEYIATRPDNIAKDLLLNYGNIPTAYINATEWSDEGLLWYSSIDGTRLISEPTGVTTLLGELVEQYLFLTWWDDVTQLIKFQAIAPLLVTPPFLDSENNLLQNQTSLKSEDKLRVSEVWISYIQKTPIDKTDERDGYKRTLANFDPTAASDFEYAQRKVYEVYSAWLSNESQVSLLSTRLLARYRNNPISLSFKLDIKDRDIISLAQVFDITFKSFVDFNGAPETIRYQIVSINESVQLGTITCEAVRFDYDVSFKPGIWMTELAPDYATATPAEKLTGSWWSDVDGLISGDDGYLWS